MAVGKNITRKKGKGKQYYFSFHFEAVGKNIKWEKEVGGRTFWRRKLRFKNCGGEAYQVVKRGK